MGKTGRIVKLAGGTMTDIAEKDISYYGKNINTSAAISINETGKQGVFFGTPEPAAPRELKLEPFKFIIFENNVDGGNQSNAASPASDVSILTPNSESEDEQRPPKCIIKFKADDDDLENGLFGFDPFKKPLERNCKSDLIGGRTVTYRNSYRRIEVEEEEYRVPKMSLRINTMVTLELDMKLHREDEYGSIAFHVPENFVITPIDGEGNTVAVIDAIKIQITCTTHGTASMETPTVIQVLADGVVSGAIDVWHPEPRTISVRTVMVEAKGGVRESDIRALTQKITPQILQQYFAAVLNPVLININLVNAAPDILNLTTITPNDRMDQHFLDIIQGTMNEGDTHKVRNTSEDKDTFFNSIGQIYRNTRTNLGQPLNPNHLLLIFTNMKCSTSGDTTSYTNGVTKAGISLMFMDNDQIKSNQEIPHEIMHGAGLPHPFSENPVKDPLKTHYFNMGSTDNYMDYKNESKRKHTWHWQWEKLYNSNYSI